MTAPMSSSAAAPIPLVRLRWTEGRYGGHFGYVGKIKSAVVTIRYSMERDDPTPRVIRVALPGLSDASRWRKAATLDEAKAIAAAMVNKWLRDATNSESLATGGAA